MIRRTWALKCDDVDKNEEYRIPFVSDSPGRAASNFITTNKMETAIWFSELVKFLNAKAGTRMFLLILLYIIPIFCLKIIVFL